MNEFGNINAGRPNLGDEMPVEIYRLFYNTMHSTLSDHFGKEKTDELFRETGFKAGMKFAEKNLKKDQDFNNFISELQKVLVDLKMGILRIENARFEKGEILLSMYEDLDCSGMPVTDDCVCVYDEGFISAILEFFMDLKFNVREIDCWASGDRVCRFKADIDQQ